MGGNEDMELSFPSFLKILGLIDMNWVKLFIKGHRNTLIRFWFPVALI